MMIVAMLQRLARSITDASPVQTDPPVDVPAPEEVIRARAILNARLVEHHTTVMDAYRSTDAIEELVREMSQPRKN